MKTSSLISMRTSGTALEIRGFLMAALIYLAFVVSSGAATLLAYWDFNDSDDRLGVSQGHGTLTLAPILVRGTNYSFYSNNGPSTNALPGVEDGQYLTLTATDTAGLGNGVTWLEFKLDMTGYHSLQMSFDQIRNDAQAFNTVTVSYSINGTDYIDQTSYTYNSVTNRPTLQVLDFSSVTALNDQEEVFIRLTYSGATWHGFTRRTGPDNIQFNAVPEASTLGMLLGASGLLLLGCRKRRKRFTARG